MKKPKKEQDQNNNQQIYPKRKEQVIQTAFEEINKLTNEAMEKIRQAQEIADKHGLTFSFNVAYGMGGRYEGKGVECDEYDYISKKRKTLIRKQGEWMASSHSC